MFSFNTLQKKQSISQKGFTLLEMLIVISIIAIMAAIAYPSMQRQIAMSKMRQTVGEIDSALVNARANALTQKRDVTVTLNTTARQLQVEGSDGMTINYPESIIITPQNGLSDKVIFTNRKTAKSDSGALTAGQGFGVCYKDMQSEMLIVTVDARAIIGLEKINGGCL